MFPPHLRSQGLPFGTYGQLPLAERSLIDACATANDYNANLRKQLGLNVSLGIKNDVPVLVANLKF